MDGKTTFLDASNAAKAASTAAPFSPGPLTEIEKHAYDMNRDGSVTFADAQLAAKVAAVVGSFPNLIGCTS